MEEYLKGQMNIEDFPEYLPNNLLKRGDTIRFHDPEDMIAYMGELEKVGIDTDFLYEKDGEKGYWLIVTHKRRKKK